MKHLHTLVLCVSLAALTAACAGDGDGPGPLAQTPTGDPAEAEVILPDRPAAGFELTDPSFEALEGAQAFFGELGGTVYRIEIPDGWNGRLVLWAHGFRGWGPALDVDTPPGIREYLIKSGYAWAASSFSSNGFVPFQGAHETAALHDFFIEEFGRPDYTYLSGGSMGGAVVLLSLELFPSRYDGALAACSAMGLGEVDFIGHYVVLGAYAAGVTQEEFDSMESMAQLVERIVPALEAGREARTLFESLVTALTGGARPFRHEGFEEYFPRNFEVAGQSPTTDAFGNTDFEYSVGSASGISAEELNSQVLRLAGDPQVRNVDPNFSNRTGAVPVPLLMMHTTGDGWVPISLEADFRRLAEAAGDAGLLVQRAVRAPGHCDFSTQEVIAAAEDLFGWVENGVKPEGEDIAPPLEDVGLDFTEPIREDDPGGL